MRHHFQRAAVEGERAAAAHRERDRAERGGQAQRAAVQEEAVGAAPRDISQPVQDAGHRHDAAVHEDVRVGGEAGGGERGVAAHAQREAAEGGGAAVDDDLRAAAAHARAEPVVLREGQVTGIHDDAVGAGHVGDGADQAGLAAAPAAGQRQAAAVHVHGVRRPRAGVDAAGDHDRAGLDRAGAGLGGACRQINRVAGVRVGDDDAGALRHAEGRGAVVDLIVAGLLGLACEDQRAVAELLEDFLAGGPVEASRKDHRAIGVQRGAAGGDQEVVGDHDGFGADAAQAAVGQRVRDGAGAERGAGGEPQFAAREMGAAGVAVVSGQLEHAVTLFVQAAAAGEGGGQRERGACVGRDGQRCRQGQRQVDGVLAPDDGQRGVRAGVVECQCARAGERVAVRIVEGGAAQREGGVERDGGGGGGDRAEEHGGAGGGGGQRVPVGGCGPIAVRGIHPYRGGGRRVESHLSRDGARDAVEGEGAGEADDGVRPAQSGDRGGGAGIGEDREVALAQNVLARALLHERDAHVLNPGAVREVQGVAGVAGGRDLEFQHGGRAAHAETQRGGREGGERAVGQRERGAGRHGEVGDGQRAGERQNTVGDDCRAGVGVGAAEGEAAVAEFHEPAAGAGGVFGQIQGDAEVIAGGAGKPRAAGAHGGGHVGRAFDQV